MGDQKNENWKLVRVPQVSQNHERTKVLMAELHKEWKLNGRWKSWLLKRVQKGKNVPKYEQLMIFFNNLFLNYHLFGFKIYVLK